MGRTTAAGWFGIAAAFAGLCVAALKLWRFSLAGKVAAVIPALAALLLGQSATATALQRQTA